MKATDIPFAAHVGVEQENGDLSLELRDAVTNHLGTMHAGAQYTLAETRSGLYLQTLFPDIGESVVPLLRDGNVKYKKAATGRLYAFASCDEEAVERFRERFAKKGRGLLDVNVDIKDAEGGLVSQASFSWFIQILNPSDGE